MFEAFRLYQGSAVPGTVVYANGADRALVLAGAINKEGPVGFGGLSREEVGGLGLAQSVLSS